MVKTKMARLAGGAVIALALVGVAAVGSQRDRGSYRQPVVYDAYLAATQIISFDDTIGLLDTSNGAIYRLAGNLDNASSRLQWQRRVAPVAGSTSGLLEIQKATFNRPDATFLVDIATGQTWILRQRAGQNRSWEPVDFQR
ncbi:MAG: hypothetical protein ACYTGC_07335 [Planctomycetota bacterium]|jgi:hypothetical protein